MTNKEAFLYVLNNKKTPGITPLWELHFQMWKCHDSRYLTGPEFNKLPEDQKEEAIRVDAQIMKTVGEQMGFGCVSIPDHPWDCIYTLPHKYRCMLVRELKALSPDFAIIAGCSGVISMPSSGDDYMDFCIRIIEEPEEVDAQCEQFYSEFEQNVSDLIAAGVDAIYTASDVADNRNTFFSPAQLERWYYPYLRRFVTFLHSRGIYALLHTDGNINSILEQLRDCGIDGLQAIDPVAGMNIERVLTLYDGYAAVCGNLDCGLMLRGTPEQVYESAKQILLAGKNHPLIFGCSNAVVPETPMENYQALLEAWRKYR